MKIALSSRALPGETSNGDGYLVATMNEDLSLLHLVASGEPGMNSAADTIDLAGCDSALVALIDGVGHGEDAAMATKSIQDAIRFNLNLDLKSLARECHRRSTSTRGAVIGLLRLSVENAQFEHLGVGNIRVEVHAADAVAAIDSPAGRATLPGNRPAPHRSLVSSPGIVGYNLPKSLLVSSQRYGPNDTILMHSDGISTDRRILDLFTPAESSAESIARAIMSDYASRTDDATVIVVK